MQTFDRCGELLRVGDVVAYADIDADSNPKMDVYILTELIDKETCKAVMMSGDAIGEEFYLSRTTSLCVYLYESNPSEDEDEEEFEPPLFN